MLALEALWHTGPMPDAVDGAREAPARATTETSARARIDVASDAGARRRNALAAARLYLVCDAQPNGRDLGEVLPAAIAGGVDVFQLREKRLKGDALLDACKRAAKLCAEAGALFFVNDYPEVAASCGADGVHVGQDDMPVSQVREIVGEQMLIGLSTHAEAEIDDAGRSGAAGSGADYIGVGPVHETPTKLGRPAVGTRLVAYAAAHSTLPFFAIGGIDDRNVGEVVASGAQRVCVLRAVAHAEHPEAAAAKLRRALR